MCWCEMVMYVRGVEDIIEMKDVKMFDLCKGFLC